MSSEAKSPLLLLSPPPRTTTTRIDATPAHAPAAQLTPAMILALVACATLFLLLSAYIALVLLSPRGPIHSASERTYLTPRSSGPQDLPNLTSSDATVELSVVVPAYNEKDRLGAMLEPAIQYLEERELDTKGEQSTRKLPENVKLGSYEVLIVDDGSRDGTSQVALELAKALEEKYSRNGRKLRGSIKVVTLVANRGKGGSVKHGILHSSGHRILFVDADGASHFPDLELLEREMDELELSQSAAQKKGYQGGQGIVVGSRAHLVRTEAVVKRSFLRNLLMRLFHTYLFLLGIRHIRDTQCGFKLHTRQSAAHIYPYLHSPAWIFDCELLLLADISGIPAREVGIAWKEIEGSKVNLVRDSIQMAIDLLVIRGNHLLGRWAKPASVGSLGIEKVKEEGEKDK